MSNLYDFTSIPNFVCIYIFKSRICEKILISIDKSAHKVSQGPFIVLEDLLNFENFEIFVGYKYNSFEVSIKYS